MAGWSVRVVLAVGLVANVALIRHPVPLAAVQAVLALAVLSGRGGTATLVMAALVLVPAPVAEVRRWLSHVPLACDCQEASGRRGLWPVAGAVADAGLIGLAVVLGRRTVTAGPGPAPGH